MKEEVLDNEFFEPVNVDMQNPRFAGFWVRVAASLIDTLIFIPVIIISFKNVLSWKILALEVLTTAAWIFYKVYMEWRYKATWGKMVMKIKVVNESGGQITLEQSFVRFSLYFLGYMGTLITNYYLFIDPEFASITNFNDLVIFQEKQTDMISTWTSFPMLISVMFVPFDIRKQALHDKMAKTFCVYT